MHVEGNLSTKFGKVSFAITDNDHVYISSYAFNVNPLVVRGIEYVASIHLHGPAWEKRTWHELYVSRPFKQVSDAARNTIEAELTQVWREFIAANPNLLKQAHFNAVESQLTTLNDKIAEAEEALVALCQKKDSLVEELTAAGVALNDEE